MELRVDARFRDCGRIGWLMDLSRTHIACENFPNPGQKARKFLAAQFVSRSPDDDVSILADVEMRVAKTPNIEAFRFAGFRRRWWGRPDDFCFW